MKYKSFLINTGIPVNELKRPAKFHFNWRYFCLVGTIAWHCSLYDEKYNLLMCQTRHLAKWKSISLGGDVTTCYFFTINFTVFTIEFDKYYNKIQNRKAALNPVRRENQCSTKSRLFHVTVSFIHLSIVYISILEQRVLALLLKWRFQKSCASTLPKCPWIKCQRLLFTNQPCAAVWFQLFWYFWFHSKTFFECHSRLFVLKRTIQFVWIIAKVFIVKFFCNA